MFDLHWLDMIRDYVSFCKQPTIFLEEKKKEHKDRLNQYNEFIGRYDDSFVRYICKLYNIKYVKIQQLFL